MRDFVEYYVVDRMLLSIIFKAFLTRPTKLIYHWNIFNTYLTRCLNALKVCEGHPGSRFFEHDIDLPKTCLDLLCLGYKKSGVYNVYPDGRALYNIEVYCDQKTDGGGWTVSW